MSFMNAGSVCSGAAVADAFGATVGAAVGFTAALVGAAVDELCTADLLGVTELLSTELTAAELSGTELTAVASDVCAKAVSSLVYSEGSTPPLSVGSLFPPPESIIAAVAVPKTTAAAISEMTLAANGKAVIFCKSPEIPMSVSPVA
ncbi:MAG: hypothetical protein LBT44_02655 [Clostridiales bacterium]|nr:hypothetical protein [Clostridiales bacterium]